MRLKMQDVCFEYRKDRTLFQNFSVQFESGKITAVCGPNGSGKSTLLKILGGLAKVRTGDVYFDGSRLDTLSKIEIARKIAYVSGFSQPHFPLTVYDFVSQGRFCHQGLFAHMNTDDRKTVMEAISEVGLQDIHDRSITELSLGQYQLALFARSFAQNPDTYLLDEAFSNLDLNHQSLVWNLLLKRRGATIVFVTHDLNFSASHSDKLLWLVNGAILNYDETEKSFTTENLEKAFPLLGQNQSRSYRIEKNPSNGKPILFLP